MVRTIQTNSVGCFSFTMTVQEQSCITYTTFTTFVRLGQSFSGPQGHDAANKQNPCVTTVPPTSVWEVEVR